MATGLEAFGLAGSELTGILKSDNRKTLVALAIRTETSVAPRGLPGGPTWERPPMPPAPAELFPDGWRVLTPFLTRSIAGPSEIMD